MDNANPLVYEEEECAALEDPELDAFRDEIFSLIRHIHDPEHPHTLSELKVVYKSGIVVQHFEGLEMALVEFTPTVPHCSMATLIGLCIRTAILKELPHIKLRVVIRPGTHDSERASMSIVLLVCVLLMFISAVQSRNS